MEEIIVVLTTLPVEVDDAALARMLVQERHAACVSVLPVHEATYRWGDVVETARERQLIIKTRMSCMDGLREAVRRSHPYELPEFLVLSVSGGDPAYLQWIRASTAEPAAGRP